MSKAKGKDRIQKLKRKMTQLVENQKLVISKKVKLNGRDNDNDKDGIKVEEPNDIIKKENNNIDFDLIEPEEKEEDETDGEVETQENQSRQNSKMTETGHRDDDINDSIEEYSETCKILSDLVFRNCRKGFNYTSDSNDIMTTSQGQQENKSGLNNYYYHETSYKKVLDFTPFQSSLYQHMRLYKSLSLSYVDYRLEPQVLKLMVLHSWNHIQLARKIVLQNNKKLKALRNFSHQTIGLGLGKEGDDLELRDQGFTRPKVLVLMPFKNDAYEFIKLFTKLSGDSLQIENKKRLKDEFGPLDSKPSLHKPADYNKTFKGNIDDCFKIGIKVTRKSIRLFASFYEADIIIASPLGLSMIIGKPGDKKRDFDYLSSIEILMMHKADKFMMQNWDHVNIIMKHLNLIPTQAHGCDFSRAKHYILDGHASRLRQTLLFSSIQFPELNALLSKCRNMAGSVKISRSCVEGQVSKVTVDIPQVFYRVPDSSLMESATTRFLFFTNKILSLLHHQVTANKTSVQQLKHTLIVIPSYFDFTRVRNYLELHNYSFGGVSEYTTQSRADRTKRDFETGEKAFLIITERLYFYRRNKIRGVERVIFYSPLFFAHFYPEMLGWVDKDKARDVGGETSACLYSKFDALTIERIVGQARMERMLDGHKAAFMFQTE